MVTSQGREENQISQSYGSPRVTIGMPVFNGERFVAEALDSALAQSFGDFEIVISDNASTDRTEQICRSYAARDHRIRYYRSNENRGSAWNHNRVVELARGEFFKWWSHDDLCAPNFLEACVSALDRDPGVVLSYSWTQMGDPEGRPLRNYQSPIALLGSPRPHERFLGAICQDKQCCYEVYGVARIAVLRQTPLIENYTGSDEPLLADLALRGRFHEVPAYLFFNRDHPWRFTRTHTMHQMAAWFDPGLKGKVTFPYWGILLGYIRAIARSELSGLERIRCSVQLLSYGRQCRKPLIRDLRIGVKAIIRRKLPRATGLAIRIRRGVVHALLSPTSRVREENVQRKA